MQLDVDGIADSLERALQRIQTHGAPWARHVGDEIDLHWRSLVAYASGGGIAGGSCTGTGFSGGVGVSISGGGTTFGAGGGGSTSGSTSGFGSGRGGAD